MSIFKLKKWQEGSSECQKPEYVTKTKYKIMKVTIAAINSGIINGISITNYQHAFIPYIVICSTYYLETFSK